MPRFLPLLLLAACTEVPENVVRCELMLPAGTKNRHDVCIAAAVLAAEELPPEPWQYTLLYDGAAARAEVVTRSTPGFPDAWYEARARLIIPGRPTCEVTASGENLPQARFERAPLRLGFEGNAATCGDPSPSRSTR